MDLCLQGSGNLHMFGSQTDWNIATILVFLGDLWMFCQAIGVNLMWYVCLLEGLAHLLGTSLL